MRAGEPPKPEGLESAKEGYVELKAATAPSAEAWRQLALPDTRDLGASIELAPVMSPETPTKSATASKSRVPSAAKFGQNWLVDAMMRPRTAPATDAFGRPRQDLTSQSNWRDSATTEPPDSRLTDQTDQEEAGDRESTALSSTALSESTEGSNPLERFLGDWMTARDLAILRPESSSSDSAVPGAPGRNLMDALAPVGSGHLGATPATPAVDSVADAPNPYLALFTDSAPSVAPNLSPVAPKETLASIMPPPALRATSPTPVATETVNAAAAEHERARDEARYFKQLKRF